MQAANASLCLPITIAWGGTTTEYFGSFRFPNAAQFQQYVSGKFYDKTFYAPKDTAPWESAAPCFESPDQYCKQTIVNSGVGDIPAWSSYCMSPAGMFNPNVMAHDDPCVSRERVLVPERSRAEFVPFLDFPVEIRRLPRIAYAARRRQRAVRRGCARRCAMSPATWSSRDS